MQDEEDEQDADGDEPDRATTWAAALLVRLIDEGGIEVESEDAVVASDLIAQLATELQRAPDDLADRVLDVLLTSDAVAEVFVSEKPLLQHLVASRPPSP